MCVMLGVKPELSVAVGCDQVTFVDDLPLSAMVTISFKQFEKTGAKTSASKEDIYETSETSIRALKGWLTK